MKLPKYLSQVFLEVEGESVCGLFYGERAISSSTGADNQGIIISYDDCIATG